MKHKFIFTSLCIVLMLTLVGKTFGLASSPAPEIAWWMLSSGGAPSTGGANSVNATLGQPITGTANGGPASLESGYWASLVPSVLYLPMVRR